MISNLSFKYFNSGEYIFENLDLKIPKNKHTVLTGPNGSGKSTLLGLISRVFYPQEGEIQISSSKIGYVGVTPLIIDATLRENFIYGNSRTLKDEVIIELAKELKISASTVSRILRSKYIQTPKGAVSMKSLLASSVSKTRKVTPMQLMEEIEKIVAGERKKLSDQKISDLLNKRGFNLARRTISKYRKKINLPSSRNR